jgi:hypothetical protein
MGIEIFQIGTGTKAAQLLVDSDNNWTSTIHIQGHQRVNIGIRVGSANSDILSAADQASATFSTFSGVLTLQRRMPEEDQSYHWRDVDTWSVTTAEGEGGSSENITDKPEPETGEYRFGVKTSEYYAGLATIRLGTS